MIATEVLRGETVRLRPVEEGDLPLYVRWFNDPDVQHWLYASERAEETLESQRERFEENRRDAAWVEWCIENVDGRGIGCVGLVRIDETHADAELYIFIGGKERWGRGYGSDAVGRVLRYAFDELGLRRVELTTDEDNLRGIRCFEKCGFVREGLLRAKRLRHGQPVGRVIMSVLREEWDGGRT